MTNKYAIYHAERPQRETQGDEIVEWSHSFLVLVDETNGEGKNGRVLQQLHFMNDANSVMSPQVRMGISSPARLQELKLNLSIAGDDGILGLWNNALRLSREIKARKIEFGRNFFSDPLSNNCRAGVGAALRVMGLNICEDFAKAATGDSAPAGTRSTLILDTFPSFPVLLLTQIESAGLQEFEGENARLVGELIVSR